MTELLQDSLVSPSESGLGARLKTIGGGLLYASAGLANLVHIASHIAPAVFIGSNCGHSCNSSNNPYNNPYMLAAALSFIPLTVYHLVKDHYSSRELERLRKKEKEYDSLVSAN